MNSIELKQVLSEKKYPEGFINDVILFYPLMVKCYGEEKVDKFLREWEYIFINKLGSSGNTYRDRKQISINLYYAEELWNERLITALFHELGHALGTLEITGDTILHQGHGNENFFVKMDEAVVSDFQDNIMFGQLSYGYYNDNIGFKCRGGKNNWHKYPFEKLYYNVFKILLGDKRNLIEDLMYETDEREKLNKFNDIVEELKYSLDEQEFGILLDSCILLILNHGYGETLNETRAEKKINDYLREDYNYNKERLKNDSEKQNFEIEFNNYINNFYRKYWMKSIEYAKKRNIIGTDIFTQSDKLCSMVADHLIKKSDDLDSIDFSTIKEISEYLVKIDNRNVEQEKRDYLINVLISYLDKLNIVFDKEIEQLYSREDLLGAIAKVIAIKNLNLENINSMSIIKIENDTVYLRCEKYLIKFSKHKTDDKSYDDCLGSIDVNTVLPQIKLNLYDKSIGDPNLSFDFNKENRLLIQSKLEDLGKSLY